MDFKHNAQVLIGEQNIHNVIRADMSDWEFKAARSTSPYYGVPQVKISQYMCICPILLSESLLFEFLNLFYWGPKAPFSSAFHFSLAAAHELKNQRKLHFARKCLVRNVVLSMGKWTKHYNWPASWKCKSQPAVAQPEENASCWRTLSLPSDTHMHRHENYHFIILITFFGRMISS